MNSKTKVSATIITIGDEILIGQIVDTNSAWLSDQITKLGINITETRSISDNKQAICTTLDQIIEINDIVIITGGLGPTNDDITKKTLSKYFNKKLVLNNEVLENIKELIKEKHKSLKLSSNNINQALVPENTKIFNNKIGTAPCMVFTKNETVIISMPGVPFEMKWITQNHILPFLKEKYRLTPNTYLTFHITGYPESELANTIKHWENNLPKTIHVAYLPSPGIIRLRISDDNSNIKLLNEVGQQLKNILGSSIIAEGKDKVEVILHNLLKQTNLTLATAESCTGGTIAKRITSNAGCSKYFKGSIVSYSNETKINILSIEEQNITKHGAVSKKIAEQMAYEVAQKLNTNLAVATTGIAGPDGGTIEKPVGTVWISVYNNGTITSNKFLFTHNREINIERTATIAMYKLITSINKMN